MGRTSPASDIALLRGPPTHRVVVLQAGPCCRNPATGLPIHLQEIRKSRHQPCQFSTSRSPDLRDRGRGFQRPLILRKPLFLEGKCLFHCSDWFADKP